MSTAQVNELSAVAFQLAAKLERYESVLDTMADQRAKPLRCSSLKTREVEQIGWFMSLMPQIAADVVDITLRHLELMGLLSKPGEPGIASPSAASMLQAARRAAGASGQMHQANCQKLNRCSARSRMLRSSSRHSHTGCTIFGVLADQTEERDVDMLMQCLDNGAEPP